MESVLGQLLVFAYIISFAEGEIRCYCNEAGCISTGYMCKSNVGMCYSLFKLEGEITRATQGCVDNLVHQKVNLCSDLKGGNTQSKEFPVLMCCKDDMCNHKDLDKYSLQLRSNGSKERGEKDIAPSGSYSVPYSRSDISEDASPDKDLWFKAAVIAVPIAGGFILILLVLLAVRMLRTDNRRSRQLIQIRRERTGLTKAQLYVTDHFSHKPEKNSSFFGEKYNSLCKESNTKIEKDGKVYEKVCDKPQRTSPSLIVWGKPSKSDFATVV